MININTISRLKSVDDSGKLAGELIDKIFTLIQEAEDKKHQQPQDQPQEQQQQPQQMPGNGQGEGGEENTPTDSTDVPDGDDINTVEMQKAMQKMEAQKKFANGEVKKQASTKTMSNRLEALKRVDVEVQQVGGTGGVNTMNALIYNLTTNNIVSDLASAAKDKHSRLGTMSHQELYELNKRIDALRDAMPETISSRWESEKIYANDNDKVGRDAIELGLELGALLGRKLSTRNEVRELVYNRTRTGSIDKKRLAEAGYGVESVFKQIHVDKYKKGLLHISLDASGSMHGTKWTNTVLMTMAICKAVSYVQNLDVTVDLRCTERGGRSESPMCVWLYDSRINKLNHLTAAMGLVRCSSMTPEGLCTEALIKRGYYKKSDTTLDTFYLNICDGQPGGINGYDGVSALDHTRRQVNILRNELNMQTLGYFVSSNTSNGKIQEATTVDEAYRINSSFGAFCHMYGARYSKYAPASDMFTIAKHMNNLFMAASCLA